MKETDHPDREQWILYLSHELPPEQFRTLAQHLESCPACAERLASWRRSVSRLAEWELPPRRRRRVQTSPVLRWAAAAVVALSLGFLLDRAVSPKPPTAEAIRAEVAAQLQALGPAKALAALEAFPALEARLAEAQATETQQALAAFAEHLKRARVEDFQAARVMIERLQRQNDAAFVALRKDLETVAALTEEEIRASRRRFSLLAAVNQLNVDKPQ